MYIVCATDVIKASVMILSAPRQCCCAPEVFLLLRSVSATRPARINDGCNIYFAKVVSCKKYREIRIESAGENGTAVFRFK